MLFGPLLQAYWLPKSAATLFFFILKKSRARVVVYRARVVIDSKKRKYVFCHNFWSNQDLDLLSTDVKSIIILYDDTEVFEWHHVALKINNLVRVTLDASWL